jgi:hypothetical protein
LWWTTSSLRRRLPRTFSMTTRCSSRCFPSTRMRRYSVSPPNVRTCPPAGFLLMLALSMIVE